MRRLARLTAAIAIPAVVVSGCGGPSKRATNPGGDANRIVATIKAFNNDPPSLCKKYGTPNLIRQNFGTRAHCLFYAKQSSAKDPNVAIGKVKFKTVQSRLYANVVTIAGVEPGVGTKEQVTLVKQGSSWKVDAIIPTR